MTKPEPDLKKWREQIDKVDDQILVLLNERARSVQKIGQAKNNSNKDVYASDRESQILERLLAANKGPLSAEAVEDIAQTIINNCRNLQKKLCIAYLGPEATFTHQSAVKHFGRTADYTPAKSISDVFDEVEKARADYGVVPIENSTEGVVNHTLDMFMESDLMICAEREDPIGHHLLSTQTALKQIKNIYSHPQALAQCRQWLETHLPGAQIHEAASTADAAAHAAMDSGAAAIASQLAGELYNLKVLAGRIQDSSHNRTRFLVIGRKMAGPLGSGKDKTSLLLSVKDKVGALHDLLATFKRADLNLTKIESRPTKKKAWEYVFFIDFLGHASSDKAQKALKNLQQHCVFVKVLGSYPKAD